MIPKPTSVELPILPFGYLLEDHDGPSSYISASKIDTFLIHRFREELWLGHRDKTSQEAQSVSGQNEMRSKKHGDKAVFPAIGEVEDV